MKLSPHALVSVAVVLFALVVTGGTLLAGIPSYPIEVRDQTLAVVEADAVIPASLALDPVSGEHAGARVRNPFNLRPETRKVEVSVPLPPPPPLMLPEPLPLTNPELLR